jgi:hypothetical protein
VQGKGILALLDAIADQVYGHGIDCLLPAPFLPTPLLQHARRPRSNPSLAETTYYGR